MENKKIVIITRNMLAGGAERVIAQIANYFNDKGVECTLITTDKNSISYVLDKDISIKEIGVKSNNKIIDRIKRYKIIRKLVKEERPNCVLTMPEDTGVYVILALLGTNIPVYVSERNNPWIMPDVRITRILRKLMYPFATGIIFQTETAKSYFDNRIQNKGVVLPNPVDANRIPEPHRGQREKVIVGAGRLSKQKNFPLLINAYANFHKKHSDYSLVIYGEGYEREKLQDLIDDLKLTQNVQLAGRKTNLLELMNNASMFILTSDYEGMPNVLLEAMCMGMPVISTDCPSGGPRQLIVNNTNGILIPVADQLALENAMNKMIDKDFSNHVSGNATMIKERVISISVFEDWYTYLFLQEEE